MEGDKGKEQAFVLVDELIAEDYVCHFANSEIHGPEGLKEHMNQGSSFFSNMQHIIKDNFAEGNKVATRCVFHAIHSGDFMGIPPTGKQLECPVNYIHRIEDGKIKEAWVDWDSFFGLTMQLGMELKPKEGEK
jgi:predicted ester cyclase